MREDSLPLSHFETLYARNPDPWGYTSSPYERNKYAATLAALPRDRYASGFEVGCSIGVLTAGLASRCDRLLAIEPVPVALAAAIERNRASANVTFGSMFVPDQWPEEHFGLIMLSEVLDYLGRRALAALAARIAGSLEPEGDLILVHWVGKKRNASAQRFEASEVLIAALATVVRPLAQHRNANYRLDVLRRF